jgi:geranylgeranyl diphosphate synthase type II
MVLDYPLREAKGLRPALVVAAGRALGAGLSELLPTASVFELLHNAFLVHDDVEDGSEMRRHAPTLSAVLGIPLAVHTGDTMLSMALGPLLDNTRLLDLGRALRVLDLVANVMRRTVEGQALELTWIATGRWDTTPAEYIEMVTLKTAWYTFAGPLAAGAIIAEASPDLIDALTDFGLDLGVAFQIRDDVLNLAASPSEIGKESCGDLWEGKRTLMLSLLFAAAPEADAGFVRTVLAKGRPSSRQDDCDADRVQRAVRLLEHRSDLDAATCRALQDALRSVRDAEVKSLSEVQRLRRMLDPFIDQASGIASEFAARASRRWTSLRAAMAQSVHRDVIESILEFVVSREH